MVSSLMAIKNKIGTYSMLAEMRTSRLCPAMTPDEMHDCLETVHWTPDVLADVLQCDIWLVKAWLDGKAEIPPKAAAWLKTLVDTFLVIEMSKPKSLKGKRFKGRIG